MGWFSRKKEAPAEPAPSKSKRPPREAIRCSCGKTFASSDAHHAHLHAEHPEHAH